MGEIGSDIQDEHDVDVELEIVKRGDAFLADARVGLDDFKERTGLDLSVTLEEGTEEEVDTLGGVVVAILGRVPVRGEIVGRTGIEFEILEADPRRVKRLKIRSRPLAAVVAEG